MSILTEKEIAHIAGAESRNVMEFARAIESEVLAKLAGMELPEPELMPLLLIGVKHSGENLGERSFTEAGFYSAASEIFKLGQNQAFAQGAASQLAKEPSAWVLTNGDVTKWEGEKVAHDFRNHDKAEPLYTLKEPK